MKNDHRQNLNPGRKLEIDDILSLPLMRETQASAYSRVESDWESSQSVRFSSQSSNVDQKCNTKGTNHEEHVIVCAVYHPKSLTDLVPPLGCSPGRLVWPSYCSLDILRCSGCDFPSFCFSHVCQALIDMCSMRSSCSCSGKSCC